MNAKKASIFRRKRPVDERLRIQKDGQNPKKGIANYSVVCYNVL